MRTLTGVGHRVFSCGLADIWAAGCTVAELMLGQPPFLGESGVDQLVEIIKVLGTPTKEEVKTMNPKYVDYKVRSVPSCSFSLAPRRLTLSSLLSLVPGHQGDPVLQGIPTPNANGRGRLCVQAAHLPAREQADGDRKSVPPVHGRAQGRGWKAPEWRSVPGSV